MVLFDSELFSIIGVRDMIKNIIRALTEVEAPLERFVLGTGGKHYGKICNILGKLVSLST